MGRQGDKRKAKVRESRYNEGYGRIKTNGVPQLKEGRKEKRVIRIARFRLGNKMRGGRY